MKRFLLTAFAVSVAFAPAAWAQSAPQPLPVAKPEQVGMSAEKLARIGQTLKREVDQGKLPGAVVMVARKGKLVYADAVGFQDKGAGTPMSKDSIFRIYSMTKPLASVAAMMLVEDGTIQLTDPVAKFLPGWDKMQVSTATLDPMSQRVVYGLVPAQRPITVQDLLRHTSGLAYGEITQNGPVKDAYTKAGMYKPAFDYEARDLTPQEQVERLGRAPLAQQPGTIWEYSVSVDALGRVVEAASGKPLEVFLEERLFKPLKMTDTAFYVPAGKMGRLAQALPTDPATGATNRLIDVSQPPKNASGGAGAVSTAADYLRFCQTMLNGGQLDGVRVLARPTVQLMTSDHLGGRIATPMQPGELLLGTPGYTFGLGFAVRQSNGVAGVPGSAGEYLWAGYAGTFFWADPKEEVCGVYMTQAPSPIRAYYRKLFKQLVYNAIDD